MALVQRSITPRRLLSALIVAFGLCLFAAAGARGDAAPFSLKTVEPAISGEGDERSVEAEFLNLTTEEIQVAATDPSNPDCTLTHSGGDDVPLGGAAKLKFTLSSQCDNGALTLRFTEKADVESEGAFGISADAKEESDHPKWKALWAFPALVFLLVALSLAFVQLCSPAGQGTAKKELRDERNLRKRFRTPLRSMPDTWSLKDSWISNVTVAAAVLTPLFASADVVKAVIGKEADSAIALATVGAPIAALLVALGPIILFGTRVEALSDDPTKDDPEPKPKASEPEEPAKAYYFSYGGLAVVTAIVVAAAVGELVVAGFSVTELSLSMLVQGVIWATLGVVALVLCISARRSLRENVATAVDYKAGSTSETLAAAAILEKAIRGEPRAGEETSRGDDVIISDALDHLTADALREASYVAPNVPSAMP